MRTDPMTGEGSLRAETLDAASAEAQQLLATYVDEMRQALPGGFDPAASASADVEELQPPRGAFVVLRESAGSAAGCGAVKLLAPGVAEVKRMWVAPAWRGRGAGRLLLAALEDAARALGATEGRLDTHESLAAALALYRGAGWQEVDDYNANRYATHWFAKDLSREPGAPG